MERPILPRHLALARLLLREATLSDCERLQEIANAGSYIDKWVGDTTEPDVIYKNITEGDLPPLTDARREYYSMKAICLLDTGLAIGYMGLYHGYPDNRSVWISILLIDPAYQRQGFAGEVVQGIIGAASHAGYESLGIGVHLKNWPALRFWVKQGFNSIDKIVGDSEHSDTTYAIVSLRQNLVNAVETDA